jgi:TolA-binding protein
MQLADAYRRSRQRDKARAILQEAIKYYPDIPSLKRGLDQMDRSTPDGKEGIK